MKKTILILSSLVMVVAVPAINKANDQIVSSQQAVSEMGGFSDYLVINEQQIVNNEVDEKIEQDRASRFREMVQVVAHKITSRYSQVKAFCKDQYGKASNRMQILYQQLIDRLRKNNESKQ